MSKFNDLLSLRFRQKESHKSKMTALVEKSNKGELSSFSGIFRIAKLSDEENITLENLLKDFRQEETFDVTTDLEALTALTSEVKAITNQAIILHGERIKKAQEILKHYKEGAFTAWLYTTYGNRQTPYNFLQYYEFYTIMPQDLHPIIDQMPRQAIYTLASRNGEMAQKQAIIQEYAGQTKQELLEQIRLQFPLEETDKRLPNLAAHAIVYLKRAREALKKKICVPSEEEKEVIEGLLEDLKDLLQRL